MALEPVMTKVEARTRSVLTRLARITGNSQSACLRELIELGLDRKLGDLAVSDPEAFSLIAENHARIADADAVLANPRDESR